MAKIIDGGWLEPSGDDSDVTIGTTTEELRKSEAVDELEERIEASNAQPD
jgi:hypothetical protein